MNDFERSLHESEGSSCSIFSALATIMVRALL